MTVHKAQGLTLLEVLLLDSIWRQLRQLQPERECVSRWHDQTSSDPLLLRQGDDASDVEYVNGLPAEDSDAESGAESDVTLEGDDHDVEVDSDVATDVDARDI